jgi:hypothetical protein
VNRRLFLSSSHFEKLMEIIVDVKAVLKGQEEAWRGRKRE